MPRVFLIHGLSSSPAGMWRVRHWLEDAGWTIEAVAMRGHGGQRPAADYALPSYASDLAATGERALHVDYRVVPGAGHSPHYDAPDPTRALVLSWLAAAS